MHIVNGTTHEINFYHEHQCYTSKDGRRIIRKEGEEPVYTIPPGTNLNAMKVNGPRPEGVYPFQVKGALKFTSADLVPEGDLIIVSNMYRAAVVELGRDTSRLATIDGAVYDEGGTRPVGSIGLAVG